MASILISQGVSLSIATIPKPLTTTIPSLALQQLKLPTRLTPSSAIRTTVSASGAIYLYSTSSSYIWEYDGRGKRISEMSFGEGNIASVTALNGKADVVVVVLEGEANVRVMEKVKDGTWSLINTLKGPEGTVTGIASSRDGRLIAIGTERGKLAAYDLKNTPNETFDVSEHVTAIPSNISFAPTLPSTLVIPSPTSSSLVLLDTSTSGIRVITPFGKDAKTGITAISFSPVRTVGGEVKGGLCAVLREGSSEVGLVGLESPNRSAKIVDFGKELVDVTFLGDAQLAAQAIDGAILVKNLRSLGDDAIRIPLGNEPVTQLQYLPMVAKTTRSSLPATTATSAASTRRMTILGEIRNAGNIPSPATYSLTEKSAGKGKEKESARVSAFPPIGEQQVEKPRKSARTTEPTATATQQRVVSAPSPSRLRPSASTSNLRTVSNPSRSSLVARPTSGRPSSAGNIVPEAIVEEDSRELEELEQTEPSVNLSWALRPRANSRPVDRDAGTEEKDPEWKMDEMRREIGNLQLDMLRMGRSLKNEIRRAVEPLMTELKDSRGVIERQRKEIERLRRGY